MFHTTIKKIMKPKVFKSLKKVIPKKKKPKFIGGQNEGGVVPILHELPPFLL